MDNELEIVSNDANLITPVSKPSVLQTAAPIAAAAVLGMGAGYLLCRFVITPLLSKKDKKEKTAKTEETKSEE